MKITKFFLALMVVIVANFYGLQSAENRSNKHLQKVIEAAHNASEIPWLRAIAGNAALKKTKQKQSLPDVSLKRAELFQCLQNVLYTREDIQKIMRRADRNQSYQREIDDFKEGQRQATLFFTQFTSKARSEIVDSLR